MAKAIWNGVVIAESDDTVVVEGNHDFPPDAVRADMLRTSARKQLPVEGHAEPLDPRYRWQRKPDAAWYYAEPKPAAAEIKGRIAFWKRGAVTA